jgi:hypothetical protein
LEGEEEEGEEVAAVQRSVLEWKERVVLVPPLE